MASEEGALAASEPEIEEVSQALSEAELEWLLCLTATFEALSRKQARLGTGETEWAG